MRWKYGKTNPVMAAVNSATVIEIGDLLYLAEDDARPASDQADQGTAAANQATFHANFLGVAMQRSASGDTADIRVATEGTFEFIADGVLSTFEIGDLVGVSENTGGDGLLDQQVIGVENSYEAIGRIQKRATTATTTPLVRIQSSVMTNGIQTVSSGS